MFVCHTAWPWLNPGTHTRCKLGVQQRARDCHRFAHCIRPQGLCGQLDGPLLSKHVRHLAEVDWSRQFIQIQTFRPGSCFGLSKASNLATKEQYIYPAVSSLQRKVHEETEDAIKKAVTWKPKYAKPDAHVFVVFRMIMKYWLWIWTITWFDCIFCWTHASMNTHSTYGTTLSFYLTWLGIIYFDIFWIIGHDVCKFGVLLALVIPWPWLLFSRRPESEVYKASL